MKRIACIAVFVALAACPKKKADDTGTGTPGGSAMTAPAGSGSAMAEGSGSAAPGSAAPGSAAPADGSGSGSAVAAGSATGSGSAAAGSGSAVAAGSGSAEAKGGSAFDKLSHDEKIEFMKKSVVPPMKEAFQKFDAKAFANFGCKTCHGKDPKATKYKMPNPELPKLDFAKLEAGKQKPEMAKFMGSVVKPQMAKILGDKEMDGAHPELGGFACLDCHEQKK